MVFSAVGLTHGTDRGDKTSLDRV